MKIGILGCNGFIGKNLLSAAKKLGHDVEGYTRTIFPGEKDEFDVFIDATSQSSIVDIKSYIQQVSQLSRTAKIKKYVVLQSFSTLTGNISNQNEINFGIRPDIFTPYSNVKFKKEIALETFDTNFHIHYIYLPIVLGDGGIWSDKQTALKKNPKIKIPDFNVYYVTLDKLLSDIETISLKRMISYAGSDRIDKVLDLNNNSTDFKYNKLGDTLISTIMKGTSKIPYLSYLIDAFLSKTIGRTSFPSSFYWELFLRQSKGEFLERYSKILRGEL